MRHLLLIFAVALVLRVVVLYEVLSVDPMPPGTDMVGYYNKAILLLDGQWPSASVYYYNPLYPLVIALSFKLFGLSTLSPRLLNCILGALVCPMVALVGEKLFDRKTGLFAGWLYAVYRGAVFHSTVMLDSTLSTLLLISVFLTLLQPSTRRGVIAGLLLSLGTLARGVVLISAMGFVVWLAVRRCYATAVIMLLTLILCLSPIVARNAHYGQLVITSNGPVNLWIGNNPDANGTYNAHPEGAARERYMEISRGDQDWLRHVVDYVTNQPLDWLQLMLQKTALWLFLPDGYLVNNVSIIGDGVLHSRLLWFLPGYGFFAIFSFAGVIVLRKRWREFVPIAVFYVPYMIATIAFFVVARFRLVVTPALALMAAIVITDIATKVKFSLSSIADLRMGQKSCD
jgi:4-amino-4-deoxy-L-arabinose transferase-like glycosyltransferase